MLFPLILILCEEKGIFFIIIWVYMHWLYVFALCLLIWLMTTKIFILVIIMFVLGVCEMVFMRIDTFKIIVSMIGGVFVFLGMIF